MQTYSIPFHECLPARPAFLGKKINDLVVYFFQSKGFFSLWETELESCPDLKFDISVFCSTCQQQQWPFCQEGQDHSRSLQFNGEQHLKLRQDCLSVLYLLLISIGKSRLLISGEVHHCSLNIPEKS